MGVRSLILAASVLGLLSASCSSKPQLAEAVVPNEGILLRYDLNPGQTYGGRIASRTSVATPVGALVMRLEYSVDLRVSGSTSTRGPLLTATLQDISASVITPTGIPATAAGINPQVAQSLNGLELRFHMRDDGTVASMPDMPEGQPPAVMATIVQLTSGLEAALVRLPQEPLQAGETWRASREHEGLKTTTQGLFKAFGRNDTGATVATLEIESSGTLERARGDQEVSGTVKGQSTVAFVASEGFASSLSRKVQQSTSLGDLSIELDAQWTKGAKRSVSAPPTEEIQTVADPCDGDYVGPAACPEDAPAEPAPAGPPAAPDPSPGDS